MTEDEQNQKHAVTLNKLLKEGFWTLSVDEEQNIRTAAKWALAEIDRLTTETQRLQDEIALLSGIVRDLENWDDETKEVIE